MFPSRRLLRRLCAASLGVAAMGFSALAGAPSLQTAVSVVDGKLVMEVSGSSLPEIRRLSLTFAYDPSLVNLVEAVVSSPLPATAFGAMLDTTAKTLVLNIVATSIVTIPDQSVVSVIRAPVVGAVAPASALQLSGAVCFDKDTNQIVLQVPPAAVHGPRRLGAQARVGTPVALSTAALTLDGRRCGVTAAGAPRIVSRRVAIALTGTGGTPLVRGRD